MIARITGILERVEPDEALVTTAGITYAVMIPRSVSERLVRTGAVGTEVTFHTMYYIEGGIGLGHLIPRLVGFLNETDLEFFMLLITVPGLSVKRSLKALVVPAKDVARAIELGDLAALRKLPEIGGKTAQKVVMELKGKSARFALLREEDLPAAEQAPFAEFQAEALSVLRQLQYSVDEAEALIRQVTDRRPDIATAEELIQELFRSQANR